MKSEQYTHEVFVRYYQNETPLVYYTVQSKAVTYLEALDLCKGIAETCHGIITETRIELIKTPS